MLQPPSRTGHCLLETLPHLRNRLRWALFLAACMALLGLPGAAGSALNCHKTCICASNIVSCSKMNLTTVPTSLPLYTAVLDLSYNDITGLRAEWTPIKLAKLHNLLLSHNGLHFLSSEAFTNVKQLRYLDLSSNSLRQLDEFIFEPLVNLEVLLLYNNHISQIDRSAFVGMLNLQKLYLSQNQISRFPLELVKDKSRLEKLSLLDVSSNKLKILPIDELQVLPAWIKNGLYFHNNPLLCTCDLYSLLAHWHIRKLNSAVDFKDDYKCVLPGPQKTQVGVFGLNGDYMNCSTFKEADKEAFLEQTLILGCDTKRRDMLKTWVMPGNVVVTAESNQTAKVLTDGSLKIDSVRPEDSGTYTCFAVSEALNETIYVVLKVHNFTMHGSGETLNTAYTTLVGCLASVVLVLIYLYLTPCRCFCCPNKGKNRGEDSIHSSMLSVTPTHEDPALKAELNRHVAFIDSKDLQGQNGKLNPNGDEDDDDLDEEAGSLGKGKRKKSVAESISSVFSDTPMVV
ncbi:amphoterin-induced protein 1 [Myripristis murdjan]|uniref:Adhesion molecule with Ig like domain 1 n=1 Tax=Myripristis murdjan TaxID=586833 RepID=A0A667WJA0_9TELE|nr:amphoterin-induced protein 1-like [Myripristis murdjan]XP_029911625.1 amphoterin-induced protein 1-like [Myripristis murdjan]XP_029911626.1 amphoterin-induced protein 1-like [Myripristis murdjan]XP_029911627.1 amphoterin-induced protein 1-like [Myripristis murdjan]